MTPPALSSSTASIVIALPSWVGDAVMSTPVLRAIRTHCPDAHVTGIMRPGLTQVLAGTPWLDELVTCDMKGLAGLRRTARAIKEAKPEACLLLPNSFRSGLAARLSGSPIRIGYLRDGRGWLLTHGCPVETSTTPTPTIDYYNRVGGFALGLDSIERRMELFITDEEQSEADKVLADLEGPFLLLNPGGNKLPKRWPASRFAQVADAMHESHGLTALVSGSPNEATVLAEIVLTASRDTPIHDLSQKGTTLGSLKAILRRVALMITNDTGPRHMAAALGTPLVTLFGPTDHRWTTIDCPHERILLAEPFLPEDMIADKHPQVTRIERIEVEDVLSAARDLLNY